MWVGGLIGAFFTGMYAVRLMRLTFYGERSEFAKEHLHTDHGEGPWTMMFVVAALAVGAILVGFLDLGLRHRRPLRRLARGDRSARARPPSPTTSSRPLISWSVGIAGGVLIWWAYAARSAWLGSRRRSGWWAKLAEHKFYFDELYDRSATRRCRCGRRRSTASSSATWCGARSPRSRPRSRGVSRGVGEAQTGLVRSYAVTLVAGAAVLAVYFLTKANL